MDCDIDNIPVILFNFRTHSCMGHEQLQLWSVFRGQMTVTHYRLVNTDGLVKGETEYYTDQSKSQGKRFCLDLTSKSLVQGATQIQPSTKFWPSHDLSRLKDMMYPIFTFKLTLQELYMWRLCIYYTTPKPSCFLTFLHWKSIMPPV